MAAPARAENVGNGQAAGKDADATRVHGPRDIAHRMSGHANGRSPGSRVGALKHPGTAPSRAEGTVAFAGPDPSWGHLAYRCGGSSGIATAIDQTAGAPDSRFNHRLGRRSPQAAAILAPHDHWAPCGMATPS
ncbi:hypothetical protein GCM10028795_05210 [Lysobacter olei]